MDAVEREVSEVLNMARFLKNSFIPVNRIPPELLSLVPDYYEEHYVDQGLIMLTHVCRRWREAFISRSSLWTCLDLTDINKTETYLRRSGSSPLRIRATNGMRGAHLNHALSLIIPYIPSLQSFTIHARAIPDILHHSCCHAPLLEELDIDIIFPNAQILDATLFNGDLSSLRILSLVGVTTHLPWTNMANLRVFKLSCPLGHEITVTRFLDLFESAPLLHTINIEDSIPESSDAPPKRTVSLRHLGILSINAAPVHSILNHLHVPIGASLRVWTAFDGGESPLSYYLPETSPPFENLTNVTAVDLCFYRGDKCVQLTGPSGHLRLYARWKDRTIPWSAMDHRILHSLGPRILSTTERLVILKYMHPSPVDVRERLIFRALSSTNNLQTLVLSQCYNRPFIFALDPNENSSKRIICRNLKELVFYTASWDYTEALIGMAKRRALRGAKLSSITMIGSGPAPAPTTDLVKLREHVTQVECKVDTAPLSWN